MKFDAAPTARRRALEAAQRYRGLTFTDRGEILLDVRNVENGRVTFSQRNQRLKLLPETVFSIHQAWKNGDVPWDGTEPWDCSTFSPHDSEVDEVRCMCRDTEQIHLYDKRSGAGVSISKEQIKAIVECIIEPWLANFPPASSEVSSVQTQGRNGEIGPAKAPASHGNPVADLS